MARILLVDDDADSRFAVREVIARLSGHDVVEAGDASSTFRLLGAEEFDLVVLDVRMPDVDGFEVCRRIRGEERLARLPVVFLTASEHQIESRLRGLEMGAADFIVKPVNNLELIARLGSVLRSKALTDEVRRHTSELEGKIHEHTDKLEALARELRLERDALRETFDVIEDGLLLLDRCGVVQLENTAGRRLRDSTAPGRATSADLGSPTGASGERVSEGLMPKLLEELARETIARGAICDRDLSQGPRRYRARAYPAAGGRALVYVRDVTAERDTELRRLQSEKLASIGMLAAGVAHEINNPASFVLANTEALAALLRLVDDKIRSESQPGQRNGLRELVFEAMTILQESKEGLARIHRIVRDLHGFSRVDDDPHAVTDVNAAVESALTMLRNELRYRAVVERDLRATRLVPSGAARLGQVFLNLILNAAHALPEGNLQKNRLFVRSYEDDDEVIVEVEDNGAGIAAEVMPHIFESFFTTKPAGLGTGLGLPISREIVRSAGGEIDAESLPGRGALFRVRLPASAGAAGERPAAPPPSPAVRLRRRILAVDDEALLLKAYRRMLVDHHDVEIALGATDALRLLEANQGYDVILCDLQMPEMSGAELYWVVKERWPALAERFIIITGGAFSVEAKKFIDEEAVARINKPFHLHELLDLVDRRVAAALTVAPSAS
jgi:signal transduction histidine kinase/two-component SAPR family response regulator